MVLALLIEGLSLAHLWPSRLDIVDEVFISTTASTVVVRHSVIVLIVRKSH